MEQNRTCAFLVKYIRENAPKITGVYKMKKQELMNIYLNILKSRQETVKVEQQEVKVDVIETEEKEDIQVDFEKLTKNELIYDINSFLDKQNKRLSGINSKTKPFLLKIIKDLNITKHYTEAEKEQIADLEQDDKIKLYELEKMKRLINKYISATNNQDVAGEYFKSNKELEVLKEIISKYRIDTYDFKEYDAIKQKEADEKFKKGLENMFQESNFKYTKTGDNNYNVNGIQLSVIKI